ncbi:sensor histidine kinase [Nocardiopsis trehalosi]|uniref:sensor histidine kinase n=1 Tax=Nocardiopsis trehalosi TaxID=109329 RepID=UPI0008369360|nr:sensor histidine kinase [Nocardiopsis trehalosi]
MPSRLRPSSTDLATALAVAALSVCSAVFLESGPYAAEGVRPLWPWGYLVIAVAVAPLAWRSRFPVPAAVVSTTASTLYYPMGFPDGMVLAAGAVALFGAAVRGYRWQAWLLGVEQFLAIHLWEAFAYGAPRLGPALGMLAWMLVVLISAEAARKGGEYRAVVRERAGEAARSREEAIRRRAADERVQLAREVHDTVAHNISLINVQAGTALYLIDSEPERAAEALATIKRTSRETLRELRATLNVLRAVDERAPRAPTPDLDRLDELVDGTRGAGLDVRVRTRGTPRRLSTNVAAAAYRIVQESLTNTVRHARASGADVELEYTADGLDVLVRDDGAAPAEGFTPGNGIMGMRERAAALGGGLDAAPDPDGGFTVRARLPDPAEPPDPLSAPAPSPEP